jgi:hypothetical protein
MRMRRTVAVVALLLGAFAQLARPAAAGTLGEHEVFSTILAQPVAVPSPVTGADGKVHLAYELMVVNPSMLRVTLASIDALAPDGKPLGRLDGDALVKLTRIDGGGTSPTLAPGIAAWVLMDVTFVPGTPLPSAIDHRITLRREVVVPEGAMPMALPGGMSAEVSFVGARVRVDPTPAVVIAPPLRGGGWLVFNGCCDDMTSHRGAVLAINGAPHVSERFAIDFVQLDAQGRLMTGPVEQLASYPYFGVPVHSVAAGTVVNLADGLAEEVPGAVPNNSSPETAGGNFVVVDIGKGRFAFYAHLQPGSLKVKLGDRVKTGDVIGLLGNTGNTTAPHLHFHVMDGRTPLGSNGLPYAFTSFVGEGVLDEAKSADLFAKSAPAVIERERLAGPHKDQLPLDDMVIRFPD